MFLHVILGVEMKKLVLCGAVLTAMAMTACSTTNGGLARESVATKANVVADGVLKTEQENIAKTAGNTLKSYSVKLQGKEYKDGNGINFAEFGQGSHELDWEDKAVQETADKKEVTNSSKGKVYLFQQNYSVIGAVETTERTIDGKTEKLEDRLEEFLLGEATAKDKIPTKGSATYVGSSRIYDPDNKPKEGKFTYNVNFETAKGNGKVENINGKDIILEETSLGSVSFKNEVLASTATTDAQGFAGVATRDGKDGTYKLGFFGPNADEVIGRVSVDDHEYDGFIGGKKQ